MEKKTLYGVAKTGDTKQWSVWTEGDTVFVEHGKLNGKMQTKTTKCKPKNVGRSNETSPEQQAELEAQSKWNKQWDKYYRETIEDAESLLTEGVMLAQDYTKHPNYLDDEFYASMKLDGCFTYGVKVLTNKGEIAIGDIVNSKLDCKVLSYNEDTGKLEYKKITNWFNNGMKPLNMWNKFLHKGDRFGITKNHKIYDEGKWVDSSSAKTMSVVNPRLQAILAGMILGDTCVAVEKRGKENHTRPQWRLLYSTAKKDEDFGNNKKDIFQGILSFKVKERISGYGTPQVDYRSSICSDLPFDLSIFYNLEAKSENYGRRLDCVDTFKLKRVFTDETLLIWYLDDGSLHYNNGNKETPRIFIDVSRYSEESLQGFKSIFKDLYNCSPTISDYKGTKRSKRLSFSTIESLFLLWRMAKIGGGVCPRKFPEGFNLNPIEQIGCILTTKDNTLDSCFESVRLDEMEAYDIEVEDNHNYFANGVLVHNCRVKTIFVNGLPEWHSRGGKTYPVPEHLVDQLKNLHELTGVTCLDGEAYIHGVKLQKIQSCVKKHNELTPQVTYQIFDVPSLNSLWWERCDELEWLKKYTKDLTHVDVLQQTLAHKDNLEDLIKNAISQGYEGLMMRNLGGEYLFQNKRSNDLLKYKLMQDSECKVIGCSEDKNGQGLFEVEWKGITFSLSMNGSQEENSYNNLKNRIGDWVNFKYQDVTEDGVPTFARGLYFRECNTKGEPLE